MKTSLTILVTMMLVSGVGIIIEHMLRRHRPEEYEDYAERTTPRFLSLPAPGVEERETPDTIDMYYAAKIELVYYAEFLAEDLRILNNANEMTEE